MDPRRPSESAVETTHLVLPGDTNQHGSAFGGLVMQWMDVAAGITAGRHCRAPVVTAAVDNLVFRRPIRLGDVVLLHASVNWAGNTSLEVGVKVEREVSATRLREHCLSGYFTFVALGEDGRPMPVPPVTPVTPHEKRRFDAAKARRAARLAARQGQ